MMNTSFLGSYIFKINAYKNAHINTLKKKKLRDVQQEREGAISYQGE